MGSFGLLWLQFFPAACTEGSSLLLFQSSLDSTYMSEAGTEPFHYFNLTFWPGLASRYIQKVAIQ